MENKLCQYCLGCINPSANIKAGTCQARIIYIEEQQKYEQSKINVKYLEKTR